MNASTILRAIPAAGAALSIAALFTVTACGNTGSASSPEQGSTVISYTVVGADDGDVAADGNKHDTFKTADSTTVALGQRVTLKFSNKDDAQHSFTLPDLGINVLIPGAKDGQDGTTTYTFTASKAGSFRWFCAIPCDSDNNGWAMTAGTAGNDQDNFMAGYITVK